MKKIFSLLILFLSSISNAQPIVGLGDFKIGMSLDEFLQVPDIVNLGVHDISTQTSSDYTDKILKRTKGKVWKQTSESAVDDYKKIYTPGIIDFEFSMALGIKSYSDDSYEVKLRFYENKLIQIKLPTIRLEFEDLLTSKYGKPIIENKTKKVICQNGYGAKSEHLDGSMYSKWGKGCVHRY